MGGREDLATLGIRTPYDVARVALNCSLPAVWIEWNPVDPEGYDVRILHKAPDDADVQQQRIKFGVWQHHDKGSAEVAAMLFGDRYAPDQPWQTLPGMRAAQFPISIVAKLMEVKADWRARAKTMTPHDYVAADAIGRGAWPHVLDPCVCSLGRIAQPHRGG